eukprot:GILJ01005734.1.p1 GENE.GILJ01005734.1~~GILJ01005734.1.p1  ORF type:complete len:273 (+),score=28.69 GILJ01005734.1:48-866(+)
MGMRTADKVKLGITVLFLAAVSILTIVVFSYGPFRTGLLSFCEWLRQQGVGGAFLTLLVFTLAVIFCLPVGICEILVGFIYGPYWGFLMGITGKQIGGCAAFFMARYLFRDTMSSWFSENPKLRLIDRALDRGQWKIVLMARFMALPMSVRNYGMGLLNIRGYVFFWCCLISSTPFTIIHMYIAHTTQSMVDVVNGDSTFDWVHIVLIVVGVVSVVAFAILIHYEIKKLTADIDIEKDEVRTPLLVDSGATNQRKPTPTAADIEVTRQRQVN